MVSHNSVGSLMIMLLHLTSFPDGDYPDETSTLTKLSKKSKPRSRSMDRDRSSKTGRRYDDDDAVDDDDDDDDDVELQDRPQVFPNPT